MISEGVAIMPNRQEDIFQSRSLTVSLDQVTQNLLDAETRLLAAAAGCGDADRALPMTVALTYTRLALAAEAQAGRILHDARFNPAYLATCLGLAPGSAVDPFTGTALQPPPKSFWRRLDLKTIRRLAIFTGFWISIAAAVLALSGCSTQSVELPTNAGDGSDEMKSSPCACQELEYDSRGFEWVS